MAKFKYPKSIKAAAKILDKQFPEWFKIVDIGGLRMQGATSCILGQLYSSYYVGMETLFATDSYIDRQNFDKVFGINSSKAEWVNEIKARREGKLPKVTVTKLDARNKEAKAYSQKIVKEIISKFGQRLEDAYLAGYKAGVDSTISSL